MKIDLHTHSRVSDGTDAPAALVRRAATLGLDVVALTDHDTFAGLDEAQSAGAEVGIDVVRGIEISAERDHNSVHLLGFGIDEQDPALNAELDKVRQGRSDRLSPVLAKLAALGLPLTPEQVYAQVGDSPSVGRPHIADALVAAGYVADRTEAFDRYLADGGPAHVPRYAIGVEQALGLVHAAGGVVVLAHPWGRGRRAQLPPDYLATLVREHGLDGIEVDHQDHDAPTRAELRRLARSLGVVVTGSSDYHGTGKVDHELGCNTTDPEQWRRLQDRIRC